MTPGATAPQIHLAGPANPGPWFQWSWPDNRRATAWRGPAQSPGLMGAAVPFVAPHCPQPPADTTGREQAWGQPFLTTPCSAFTAIATACWPPSPPIGQTNSCRSPKCSVRSWGRSPAAPAPNAERNGDAGPGRPDWSRPRIDLARHGSASTAQPLPTPSTIHRRPKFARL